MSGAGVYQEVWSQRTCSRCIAAGREQHLQYVITDEAELSSVQVRCVHCRSIETLASATGNGLRKRLLQAEKRARSRVFAMMVIGALFALGAVFITATALAGK